MSPVIIVDSSSADYKYRNLEWIELEGNKYVISWAKNDHLGFVINYVYRGIIHKFYPDFLIRLSNGKTLILEVKSMDDQLFKRYFLNGA